uniref:hypothetical protein n=1 Tax=Halorussus TaxID=1070314 RepID=UPI000E21AB07
RERSPSAPAARRLLDAAAAPDRADPDELEAALDRAVSAIETVRTLERAFEELPDAGEVAPSDVRRAGDRLDRPDDEVTAGVRRLAEAAAADRSATERRETERDRVAEATDVLTAAATESADLDVGPDSGRPAAERLRGLADAVERGELGLAEDGAGRVGPVATEVRRERSPESAVAKRLLDRLASPGLGDLRAALDTAVEQLDAASTTRSVVADLDDESVLELADGVAARLDGATGPAADALADRVADLRGMVDRADDSNAVIPYAVRSELRFYDRTLVDELGASGAGAASAGTAGADLPVAEVADRREAFEDRYVDGRRDHNHSIPLHFLSLVDALREDAEAAAAAGDDARAAGLLAAADETLDYVEELYERNEYSVMLRRLRG